MLWRQRKVPSAGAILSQTLFLVRSEAGEFARASPHLRARSGSPRVKSAATFQCVFGLSAMSGDQSVPLMQRRPTLLWPVRSKPKAQQRFKIAEIRVALVEVGLVALDKQAVTLGLSRSTAWTILNPSHKSSGLSARTISRILQSPRLPGCVRQRILEYVQEKIEGLYGHTERRRREFAKCLTAVLRNESKSSVAGTTDAVRFSSRLMRLTDHNQGRRPSAL